MSEVAERSNLGWLMAALVLVIGGSQLDAARPLIGSGLALAGPIVPMIMGMSRVEGVAIAVDQAGKAVAWVTIIAGELCVLCGFFQQASLVALMPAARFALYAALLAGLVIHVLEARSKGTARFAGYLGIAVGFGVHISDRPDKDPLAGFFAPFFVGVLVGGAALVAGTLLSRLFVKPSTS